MELFVDRLIRNFSPDDHRKYGGTIALREASDMRMISPMLCNAFEATALTFAGRRDGNRSVELAGHAKYVRTLRQLQAALYDTEGNKSTEVLVVVLLSTITEVSYGSCAGFHGLISSRPSNKRRKTLYLDTSSAV